LESNIDDALESDNPDDILKKAYFLLIDYLKEYTCIGRHATEFSEFFYVRFILKYLEKHLRVKFKPQDFEKRKSVYITASIEGKELILSSDNSFKTAGISINPDIFIGIKTDEQTVYSIAIFEIKLHQNEKNIENLITRFSILQNDLKHRFPNLWNMRLSYMVWLYLRYENYEGQTFEEEFTQFKNSIDNSFLMVNIITEWTNDNYTNKVEPQDGGINNSARNC